MEETIAVIEKNRSQDVRVRLTEWQGRDFIDIRLFTTADASGERVPTRKGVSLSIPLLPELFAAIREAQTRAAVLLKAAGDECMDSASKTSNTELPKPKEKDHEG